MIKSIDVLPILILTLMIGMVLGFLWCNYSLWAYSDFAATLGTMMVFTGMTYAVPNATGLVLVGARLLGLAVYGVYSSIHMAGYSYFGSCCSSIYAFRRNLCLVLTETALPGY